jgi:hypothetical protein
MTDIGPDSFDSKNSMILVNVLTDLHFHSLAFLSFIPYIHSIVSSICKLQIDVTG